MGKEFVFFPKYHSAAFIKETHLGTEAGLVVMLTIEQN